MSNGIDQNGNASVWSYTTMSASENRDLYLAYNGIEWSVSASIEADRQADGWHVQATFKVFGSPE